MPQKYWLIKSEPDKYPFDALLRDKWTRWDGVRNFEACRNLRGMKKGELAFYYHSTLSREIVGIARIVREAYPDPSSERDDWSAVDLTAVVRLVKPVALDTIKDDPILCEMALVKRWRLSVVPVTHYHFTRILEMARTKMPR